MKTEKKGFTLIELLVVIAIIGLLSTLSILALNSARAKARDAKRVSDVKQMQVALELYYNEYADYPDTGNVEPGDSIGPASAPYLRAVPAPPTPADAANCDITATATYSTTRYTYTKTNTGAGQVPSYTISFCLGSDVSQGPTKVTGNAIRVMTPAGVY